MFDDESNDSEKIKNFADVQDSDSTDEAKEIDHQAISKEVEKEHETDIKEGNLEQILKKLE